MQLRVCIHSGPEWAPSNGSMQRKCGCSQQHKAGQWRRGGGISNRGWNFPRWLIPAAAAPAHVALAAESAAYVILPRPETAKHARFQIPTQLQPNSNPTRTVVSMAASARQQPGTGAHAPEPHRPTGIPINSSRSPRSTPRATVAHRTSSARRHAHGAHARVHAHAQI